MLRICQVMECTIGGTRRHIRDLCHGLAEGSFDVTLIASSERDETFREDLTSLSNEGVRVIELAMVREIRPTMDIPHLNVLARHFRNHRYDIIHTHSSKAGVLGRAAAMLGQKTTPRIHTPHTFAFDFTEQFSRPKRRVFLGIERFFGRRSARLVHVSESEKEEAENLGITPSGRGIVIPNGIDPAPFDGIDGKGIRQELGVSDDVPLLGTVGLLNEAKGHSFLVQAMPEVLKEHPDCVAVIVGEGVLRNDLEVQIGKLGLKERVRLLGYRRDIPELLAALDVFCMPSLWEGMPYGILEAMASGLPVVASDVNGCRDLVEDGVTGQLVPSERSDLLAASLNSLLGDRSLLSSMGQAGSERVRRHYLDGIMVSRYADLYREVAERES